MPEARKPRIPGVSYKADGPLYEMFIAVRSTTAGTTVSLMYNTRSKGDEPGQGHSWIVRQSSPKPAQGAEHLGNLAAWAIRQAVGKRWQKRR